MSTSPVPTSSSWLPFDVLFDNPVFAGGAGLAGLGAAAAVTRKFVGVGATSLKRRLLINVEISKRDESYQYVPNTLPIDEDNVEF